MNALHGLRPILTAFNERNPDWSRSTTTTTRTRMAIGGGWGCWWGYPCCWWGVPASGLQVSRGSGVRRLTWWAAGDTLRVAREHQRLLGFWVAFVFAWIGW